MELIVDSQTAADLPPPSRTTPRAASPLSSRIALTALQAHAPSASSRPNWFAVTIKTVIFVASTLAQLPWKSTTATVAAVASQCTPFWFSDYTRAADAVFRRGAQTLAFNGSMPLAPSPRAWQTIINGLLVFDLC